MMTKLRVLVLESDPQLQPVLVAVLGPDAVVASSSPTLALARTREAQPTVAIVSLPLSDCHPVLVVRALRQCLPGCPILLLSPRGRPLGLSDSIGSVIQERPGTIQQLMQQLELLLASHHGRTDWVPQLSTHVLRAAEYLGRHYARSITVDEVAKAIWSGGSTPRRRVRQRAARRLRPQATPGSGTSEAPELRQKPGRGHRLGGWPHAHGYSDVRAFCHR
jgi:hypothetical protein